MVNHYLGIIVLLSYAQPGVTREMKQVWLFWGYKVYYATLSFQVH